MECVTCLAPLQQQKTTCMPADNFLFCTSRICRAQAVPTSLGFEMPAGYVVRLGGWPLPLSHSHMLAGAKHAAATSGATGVFGGGASAQLVGMSMVVHCP